MTNIAKRRNTAMRPGDIVPVLEKALDFPFAVECKNNQGITLDDVLRTSKESMLEKFWAKLIDETEGTCYEPVLIWTKNNHPDYIMFDFDYYLYLVEEFERLKRFGDPPHYVVLRFGGDYVDLDPVVMMLLGDLTKAVSGADFLKIAKESTQ